MNIALFLLAVFGATYVVVDSAIFAPLRLWIAQRGIWAQIFIYCAYCVSFWVAAVFEVVLHVPQTVLELARPVGAGLVTMGAVAVLKAVWPTFLMGAADREREILEALRSSERADETRQG